MKKTEKVSAGLPGVSLQDHKGHLKVLYYGRQGTGKTTMAASAANQGPVLVIDAEGGLNMQALSSRGVNVEQVQLWPGDGSRITTEALTELHQQLAAILEDDPSALYAVVFDSMTEIHHILRENATAKRVESSRVVVDPDYVDREDYNRMTTQLRRLIRLYRDLPCHVIITALERTEESGEIRPALSPALATDVMGYVDLVARTQMVQEEPVARFTPTGTINAKDRLNVYPAVMALPTFERVEQVSAGVLDLSQDQQQQDLEEALAPPPADDQGGRKRQATKK